MADMDGALPALSALIERRLVLLRQVADSLERSQSALLQNDAEAIARGAAHQAELCRQWSLLEDELRQHSGAHAFPPFDADHCTQLRVEWDELQARIRHLTRVHWSLLRHLQRSLAVLERVAQSCAPTYTRAFEPRADLPLGAGGY